MDERSEKRELIKVIREVGATGFQLAAATILYQVNGLENALEFLYGCQKKGLTVNPLQMSLWPNAAAKVNHEI